MKYRWVTRPVNDPDAVRQLQTQLNNLPEALARSLVLRGADTFERARLFFRPSLTDLHDPFLMRDMDRAARRVADAIARKERVLVYGDYDVDGTTSTALMTSFLRRHGVEASFFIPDRVEDGYGLGRTGLDHAATLGATLVVALDCGITAVEEAAYARSRGLDLIICDHHHPDVQLPVATAVLNPKRDDCEYPYKELSGCGVGFKLIQATLHEIGAPAEYALEYLDLVAISTASDIVPINGENRVLMSEGLKVLQQTPRLGITKLAERAGVDLRAASTTRIVFSIGPRINAAGRMGDACRAVELLLETDEREAERLAGQLEEANHQRRDLDQTVLRQALSMADTHLNDGFKNSVVLYRPDWHPGVIGIVASRIVDRFYRPAIMMSSVNGEVKGSARSISGVNVYDALRACEDLLSGFGGHDYAAGLTLPAANVQEFQRRFDQTIAEMMTPDVLTPAISVDATVQLADIDGRFWSVLRQFEPHGPENECPIFRASDLEISGEPRTIGRDAEHLKFYVRQQGTGGKPMEVVAFRMGKFLDTVVESRYTGRPLELLFSLQENTFRGVSTLQLKAHDLRISD